MNRKPSITVSFIVAAVGLIAALAAFGRFMPAARAQAETPTPEPPPGATRVRETDGAVMVYVPAGEFLMGSPLFTGQSPEWPQHIVYLDGYWVDRTEVTNRQFQAFVRATGYRTLAETKGLGGVSAPEWSRTQLVEGADWSHPKGPDSDIAGRLDTPVVQVNRDDAQAFCEWAGGHLPTEAEWEKACRGTDARRYPWGNHDVSCDYAVYDDGSGPACGQVWGPWPAGGRPAGASLYGALDMAGNVREWVADWLSLDYYAQSPAANPPGPDDGTRVIARGGCWTEPTMWHSHECAVRGDIDVLTGDDTVGFRCVVPASTAPAAPPAAEPLAAAEPASRVLLLGDSAGRFVDRYLPRLAASGDAPIVVDSRGYAVAGATLVAHSVVLKYPAQEATSGNWDVVILEQDLDSSWRVAEKFCGDAGKLSASITQAGAETVLVMPWDNTAIKPPTLQETADVYTQCGAELGLRVAPVGLAFERAITERPDLALYIADGTRANQRGFYLALNVLYATLFDRSPVGLTYRMDDVAPWTVEYALWDLANQTDWQISEEQAAFLQRIAWETVQAYEAGGSSSQ